MASIKNLGSKLIDASTGEEVRLRPPAQHFRVQMEDHTKLAMQSGKPKAIRVTTYHISDLSLTDQEQVEACLEMARKWKTGTNAFDQFAIGMAASITIDVPDAKTDDFLTDLRTLLRFTEDDLRPILQKIG